ncbi:MAG: hypothetical protein AABW49_03920 [Nanoarchaeota archaeon]
MATTELGGFIRNLEEFGIYEVALPFLLVFTIIFAILQKSKILGESVDKHPIKNLNVVISLVMAFFFVRNENLVTIVNRFLPNVSLFMVVILMFLLLIGLVYGSEYKGLGGAFLFIGAILSVVFIIWSLSSDSLGKNNTFNLPRWATDISPDTKTIIIVIAVIFLLVWWLSRDNSGGFTAPDWSKPGSWYNK